MSDKIEFGAGFTAELRGDGEYYVAHPNGGGAMASVAEAALIRALVAARGERDFTRGERDAYRYERDALAAENKALRLKAAHSLANNLCADHRDKQEGKPCLACELEAAQRRAAALYWPGATQ